MPIKIIYHNDLDCQESQTKLVDIYNTEGLMPFDTELQQNGLARTESVCFIFKQILVAVPILRSGTFVMENYFQNLSLISLI